MVAQYYAAGSADERVDYIDINTYRYVNTSSGHGPLNAYDGLATEVVNLPVPVFLTESGGLNIPASATEFFVERILLGWYEQRQG